MRGDDLRGIGAVRESDMVGAATGSIPVAGPTVTVWSRGSRESEHRVHQAHQVNANACFDELLLGELTVRGACRV